jgi:Histidine kinase-, DNA gyrase B-, and HSP90-like ATPase
MSKAEHFPFTAELIGSEILARFSEDIYTPKAIVRELVKNAYDSYYELEHHLETIEKDLDLGDKIVKVNVVDNDVLIADEGLGLDLAGFTRLISIALTEKRGVDGVSGFRGIGFWSAYTGGDRIVVESTRFGSNRKFTLTLNTKLMRSLQGPNISIGKMMNDSKCMSLVSDPAKPEDHFTKVLVRAESDEARLKSLIQEPNQMRAVLLEGCSCELTDQTPHHTEIHRFYTAHSIRPAKLQFQDKPVTRDEPSGIIDFNTQAIELTISGKRKIVAQIWYATNAENARLDVRPGIQIFRDSFPVGVPNLYSERSYTDSLVEITRRDLLDWHTGEVHLLHDALKPDASGEHVRDSALLVHFREELRKFYEKRIQDSYVKQRTKTIRSEYSKLAAKVATIAEKVQAREELGEIDLATLKDISGVVSRDNEAARKKLAPDAAPGSRDVVIREDDVKKNRRQITKILTEIGAYKNETKKPGKMGKPSKKNAKTNDTNGGKVGTGDSVPRPTMMAALDDVRDAIMEVLEDEPALQKDLLDRVNQITKRL